MGDCKVGTCKVTSRVGGHLALSSYDEYPAGVGVEQKLYNIFNFTSRLLIPLKDGGNGGLELFRRLGLLKEI